MGFLEFIALVIVAAIVGAIGEAIAGYSHPGCAMSTIVGFIGAFVGRWIQSYFHLPVLWTVRIGTTVIPLVWAVVGAALLVFVVRILFGRRRRYD